MKMTGKRAAGRTVRMALAIIDGLVTIVQVVTGIFAAILIGCIIGVSTAELKEWFL